MINFLETFTDYIGTANLLTIILFLLCLFFAFIFYFKTFYRLVYSTGVICPICNELGDFVNKNNQYTTRVLFYNNGRKTLTKDENKGLTIISKNGEIKNERVLKGDKISLFRIENGVNIQFDNVDSKDLFVIEIEHIGHIEIVGRISETGKILNTEPQSWLIINIIFFALCFGLNFYTLFEFINTEGLIEKIPIAINLIFIFLIVVLIRFIHSLFFIPDTISSKYLNIESKLQNEFVTQL